MSVFFVWIFLMEEIYVKLLQALQFCIILGQVWIYRQSNGQTSGQDEERELRHAQVSAQTWVVGYISRTW